MSAPSASLNTRIMRAFGHIHDLFLVGEAHFDVDLR